LCSCDDCKQSKVGISNHLHSDNLHTRSDCAHMLNFIMKALNAYEFERHAGAKTKHPNNHIYFENGKTIYAVVQELKNTPQEMLFDAIQNVTGSTINQKNFRVWKGIKSSVCLVIVKNTWMTMSLLQLSICLDINTTQIPQSFYF